MCLSLKETDAFVFILISLAVLRICSSSWDNLSDMRKMSVTTTVLWSCFPIFFKTTLINIYMIYYIYIRQWSGRLGFNPSRVIAKTQKIVHDTSLLNTRLISYGSRSSGAIYGKM